jgi:hypothetical protein
MKFIQTSKNGMYGSQIIFPSADHYPKNFNTKISKKDSLKY